MEEKKKRGFANMDPERIKELAQMGGKASQDSGKAHKFTKEEARKGGIATRKKKTVKE